MRSNSSPADAATAAGVRAPHRAVYVVALTVISEFFGAARAAIRTDISFLRFAEIACLVAYERKEATMGMRVIVSAAAIAAFGLAADVAPARAQEQTGSIPQTRQAIPPGPQGRHGVGHEYWHEQFYSRLIRKDTKTSCCNLTDCVPTQSRMVGDGYEVLVEGEWTPVPQHLIQNVTAPDGGAHVCFPKQPHRDYPKGTLFCVVLPPET